MYRTRHRRTFHAQRWRSFKLWLISGCRAVTAHFFVRIGVVFCLTSCPRRLDPAFRANTLSFILFRDFLRCVAIHLCTLVIVDCPRPIVASALFVPQLEWGREKLDNKWDVGGLSFKIHVIITTTIRVTTITEKVVVCFIKLQMLLLCVCVCVFACGIMMGNFGNFASVNALRFSCVTISPLWRNGLFTVKSCTAAAINPAG